MLLDGKIFYVFGGIYRGDYTIDNNVGSQGIGLGTAKKLAQRGGTVHIIARNVYVSAKNLSNFIIANGEIRQLESLIRLLVKNTSLPV